MNERMTPTQIMFLGEVRRWHTKVLRREQTVGEHSALVALLALYLAPEDLHGVEKAEMLELALIHDAHEMRFGDTPGPAKAELMKSGIDIDAWCRWAYWHGDPYDQVTDRVRDLVEVADVLEAALFAQINAPLIADQVGFQAIETARARLDNRGVSMVIEALGMGVEVGR